MTAGSRRREVVCGQLPLAKRRGELRNPVVPGSRTRWHAPDDVLRLRGNRLPPRSLRSRQALQRGGLSGRRVSRCGGLSGRHTRSLSHCSISHFVDSSHSLQCEQLARCVPRVQPRLSEQPNEALQAVPLAVVARFQRFFLTCRFFGSTRSGRVFCLKRIARLYGLYQFC
jgi:hypothetical protein